MTLMVSASANADEARALTRRGRNFEFDVAIVGLGYVGLPTALAYFSAGARVLAVDVSETRLDVIRTERADLQDSDKDKLSTALHDERFLLTNDLNDLTRAAAIVVCVPTPVDENLAPDLRILRSACEDVVALAVPDQLIMLTSTSYVGCTRDLVVGPLEKRGFTVGVDIFVAYSPERIDPGNDRGEQSDVPRVVGGATEHCTIAADHLLAMYVKNVHRTASLEISEMSKLLENTFRAVNIAMINEFADVARELHVPINDVIAAASTKPYGFMPFTPGPGVGGHCIPCDPHYLLAQLGDLPVAAPVISQAMDGIAQRPTRVAERVQQELDAMGVHENAKICVVGVAYKPDVEDLRESPALEIIQRLRDMGHDVAYVDERIPSARLHDGVELTSLSDPASFGADIVLIHTRHRNADLSWIAPNQAVIDATFRSSDIPQRVLL